VRDRIIEVKTDQRDTGLQKYRIEELVSLLPVAHPMGMVVKFDRHYNLECFATSNQKIDVFLTQARKGSPPITSVQASYLDQVRHPHLRKHPEILTNHGFQRVEELELGCT